MSGACLSKAASEVLCEALLAVEMASCQWVLGAVISQVECERLGARCYVTSRGEKYFLYR